MIIINELNTNLILKKEIYPKTNSGRFKHVLEKMHKCLNQKQEKLKINDIQTTQQI